MVFNSLVFAVFFVVVYGLFLLLLSRRKVQNLMLLIASYIFYGWWDYRFLTLLWASTIVDYALAAWMDRRDQAAPAGEDELPYRYSPGTRRFLLIVSLVANLGMLGVFKYYDFFAGSLGLAAAHLGLHFQPHLLSVVLPVGISFYTFQTLSYTIDVYRGQLRSSRSLLDFALFISFFPQLVAGPIVRACDFLPQVARPRRLQAAQIYEGAYLILWGLFQKVVIADNLARLVDRTFGPGQSAYDGQTVLIAVYAFAIQIYCDFAGYTDIARGCAKMMGFEFTLNFNMPYLARNPSDFWRRWHISLSTWLRDYLYIPLGGNRGGTVRICANLMITMLLGGLWHGAAWTFVLWGAFHGVLLVAHRLTRPWLEALAGCVPARLHNWGAPLSILCYFHLTCLGWLLFRAESIGQVWAMLQSLGTPWAWWVVRGANRLQVAAWSMLLAYTLPLVLMHLLIYLKDDLRGLLRLPALARGLGYAAMFYGLVWFGVNDDRPFIYFQF